MDSKGYNRLLILALVFATQCLQGTHPQNVLNADDPIVPEELDGEETWESETFNDEADQTYNLVFHKYNNRIRPPDFVIKVDLAVTLTHVRHLDVAKQELQTVLDLELFWWDSRLQWRPYMVTEIHESVESVWCPDIVYTNGVAPAQQLYPSIVKIVNNGSVTWLRKEIVTTRCETDPSSRDQLCPIKIGFVLNHEKGQNKFFFSEDSKATVASDENVFSHEWLLTSMVMNDREENETRSYPTIDLELAFERQSLADSENDMTEASSRSDSSTMYTTDNANTGGNDRTVSSSSSSRHEGGRSSGSGCSGSCNCGCPRGSGGGSSSFHIRSDLVMASSLLLCVLFTGGLKHGAPFADR